MSLTMSKEIKINTDKLVIVQLSGFSPDVEEEFARAFSTMGKNKHNAILTNVNFKVEIIKGNFTEILKLSPHADVDVKCLTSGGNDGQSRFKSMRKKRNEY